MDTTERFYTVDDFCRIAKISRVTFYHWRKLGLTPALMRVGDKNGRIRISHRAFEVWEAQRTAIAEREVAA